MYLKSEILGRMIDNAIIRFERFRADKTTRKSFHIQVAATLYKKITEQELWSWYQETVEEVVHEIFNVPPGSIMAEPIRRPELFENYLSVAMFDEIITLLWLQTETLD